MAGAEEWASEKCVSHSSIFELFSGDVLSMEEEQCVGGHSEPKEAQQVGLLTLEDFHVNSTVNSTVKIKNGTDTCQN